MHVHDLTRDRKAEAGATFMPRAGIVDLLEFHEDFRLIFGGDSRPGVAYRHVKSSVGLVDTYFHLAGIREPDRIAHEIDENLRHVARCMVTSTAGITMGRWIGSITRSMRNAVNWLGEQPARQRR